MRIQFTHLTISRGASRVINRSRQNRTRQDKKTRYEKKVSEAHLSSLLDQRDVVLDAERPVDVQVVLVQLQQEHDQAVERVTHEEDEHRLVAQLGQVVSDAGLRRGLKMCQ